MAEAISQYRNIIPIISFEGLREETNARRGDGIYERLLETCSLLRERNIFFGCSITTTCENFSSVLDESFIRMMQKTGIRVFTYVEYVPINPGTQNLVLSSDQKRTLQAVLTTFNSKFPSIFLCFPGDEAYYGGCLAAGRGFIHVSPSGDLEPCPAAPVSDANLITLSLKEALRSRLLARIREEPDILTETEGGCALLANKAWVQELGV